MSFIKTSFNLYALSICSFFTIFGIASCKKTDLPPKPSVTTILRFDLKKGDNTLFSAGDVVVTLLNDSINIIVPGTADITKLIPQITAANAATVSPKSGVLQDFTYPIKFTVTAENGATKTYVVSVKAVFKNTVYFGGQDNNFYALDSRTGNLIWKYTSNGDFAYSTPIINNGTIYTTNTDYNLYALDQGTGNLKWKFTTKSTTISSPIIADGVVYFGSDDHIFYAIDATTGILKWQYLTLGNVDSSPVIENGIVYVGSTDGYLYAFDKSTGVVKWMYNAGLIVEASPVISNGLIFIGTRGGYLLALNSTTGKLRWATSFNGISMEQSRPIDINGIIYIAGWFNINNFNMAGNLNAVDETTGNILWTSLTNKGFSSGPTYSNNKIFINADDGYTYAVENKAGTTIWKLLTYANGAMLTVSNGTVYTGGGGTRYFYSLNSATGKINWTFGLPNSIDTSKPLVLDANGNSIDIQL